MPSLDKPEPDAPTGPTQHPGGATRAAESATRIDWRLPDIHPDGRKFMVASGALALILFLILGWSGPGWLLVGVTIWIGIIFRDPIRTTPTAPGLVVAPVDGLVTEIARVNVPAELAGPEGLGDGPRLRVSIAMTVFDCQIVRSPIAGGVRRLAHAEGQLVASDFDPEGENERLAMMVEAPDGTRVGISQSTGLIGHRLIPWVEQQEIVLAGQRIGIVRFGSRTDIYLPAGTGSALLLGQRTVAGETVLARLGRSELIEGIAQ